jgi:hypothetical protein
VRESGQENADFFRLLLPQRTEERGLTHGIAVRARNAQKRREFLPARRTFERTGLGQEGIESGRAPARQHCTSRSAALASLGRSSAVAGGAE